MLQTLAVSVIDRLQFAGDIVGCQLRRRLNWSSNSFICYSTEQGLLSMVKQTLKTDRDCRKSPRKLLEFGGTKSVSCAKTASFSPYISVLLWC